MPNSLSVGFRLPPERKGEGLCTRFQAKRKKRIEKERKGEKRREKERKGKNNMKKWKNEKNEK